MDSWLLSRPSTLVPNKAILDKSLSAHARLLYFYILGRAGKRGWFFPDGGMQEMADDLGMGLNTVRRSVDALEVAGLVSATRTNHYGAARYAVVTEASQGAVPESPPTESGTPPTQGADIKNTALTGRPNTGSEHTPDENTREEHNPDQTIPDQRATDNVCSPLMKRQADTLMMMFAMGYKPDDIKSAPPPRVNEIWKQYQQQSVPRG